MEAIVKEQMVFDLLNTFTQFFQWAWLLTGYFTVVNEGERVPSRFC